MVKGLSPRAYRKEITRGVDELTAKIKLVEEGRWCEEREPLLKSYAAGLATEDQALQAEHHLAHCRHCHDFVAKLNGHLHDVGAGLVVPGALEALDPHATLFERIGAAAERVRETVAGAVSRSDPSDAVATATAARGARVRQARASPRNSRESGPRARLRSPASAGAPPRLPALRRGSDRSRLAALTARITPASSSLPERHARSIRHATLHRPRRRRPRPAQ